MKKLIKQFTLMIVLGIFFQGYKTTMAQYPLLRPSLLGYSEQPAGGSYQDVTRPHSVTVDDRPTSILVDDRT